MAAPTLRRTPLNAFQIAQGGKMVDFAGWHMAVWFHKDGLVAEHHHCRKAALLFDVSHMKQLTFRGKDAERFIEWATPADLQALPNGKGRLTWLPNERATVIDDCIVHRRTPTEVGVVVNAGCADKDIAHFRRLLADATGPAKRMDVALEVVEDRGLVALQGPRAAEALAKFVPGLEKLDFMCQIRPVVKELSGTSDPLIVTRCGYTGEDGFEIAMPATAAEAVAARLLGALPDKAVQMGGLGCRDTLRLEAGMCLYGHELSEDINPVEAGLTWQLTKRRREGVATQPFVGSDVLAPLLKAPPARRRVGLTSKGACARELAEVRDAAGNKVGFVTSGSPSPSLGGNIHQAYVATASAAPGTELQLVVRNKPVAGKVTKLPFIEGKYFRLPTPAK
jgi:aminomethyltransferase